MGDEPSPQRQRRKSGGDPKQKQAPSSKPKSKAKIVDSSSEAEIIEDGPTLKKQVKKAPVESDGDAPPEKAGQKKPQSDNCAASSPPLKSSRKRKPEVVEEKAKALKKPRVLAKSKAAIESGSEGEADVDPEPARKMSSIKKAKKAPTPPSDAMDVDPDGESELSESGNAGAESDTAPKRTKKANGPTKERKRKSSTMQYKSREFIEDSDDENEGLNAPSTSKPAPRPAKPANTPKSKPKSKPKPKDKETDATREDSALRSESEISVLLDKSSPAKTKEKNGRGKGKSEGKEAKAKKPRGGKELTKDEEAIKRLKSFIVACGVRKMWAKEFKDMDTASQQIAHLRRILTDLGMNSRPSMEQARAIKIRRELAQEIEDVKEFDASVNAPRRGRAAAPRHSLAEPGGAADAKSEDDDDDDDEGRSSALRKKKPSFNFLDDQSEDE